MALDHSISTSMLALAATPAERRAALLLEEQERASSLQERLLAQTSPLHTPEERIRIWEKLHVLDLPKSATHGVLKVIADQTQLTLQQVREEQQRRAALVTSALNTRINSYPGSGT